MPRIIAHWFLSRKPIQYLAALPALIVLVLLVGAFLIGSHGNQQRYRTAIKVALKKGDVEIANEYAKKLIDADPDVDLSIRYIYLVTARLNPQSKEFQSKLNELAPLEFVGYGPAHLRVAQVMAAKFKMLDPETIRILEHHLRSAIIEGTEVTAANLMLGHVYLNTGRSEQARKCFEEASKDNLDAVLALAKIYKSQGKRLLFTRALSQGERLIQEHQGREMSVELRLTCAELMELQGKITEAKGHVDSIIQDLTAQDDSDVQLDALRNFSDLLAIKATIESLQIRPISPKQFSAGWQTLMKYRGEGKSVAAIDQFMCEQLVSGDRVGTDTYAFFKDNTVPEMNTAMPYYLLSNQALVAGDSDKAAEYLERGRALEPNHPVILNNLAHVYSTRSTAGAAEGLKLANLAIKNLSEGNQLIYSFRETRGQIYAKLNRWEEARDDLEFAIEKLTGNKVLRNCLLNVYGELGETRKAEQLKAAAVFD